MQRNRNNSICTDPERQGKLERNLITRQSFTIAQVHNATKPALSHRRYGLANIVDVRRTKPLIRRGSDSFTSHQRCCHAIKQRIISFGNPIDLTEAQYQVVICNGRQFLFDPLFLSSVFRGRSSWSVIVIGARISFKNVIGGKEDNP
jgi:hypothetical protein